MKLIIQVPCYNEAETLTIALNALPKHIDGIDEIEYLVIDDGSKDDTERVAREWGVNYIVKICGHIAPFAAYSKAEKKQGSCKGLYEGS